MKKKYSSLVLSLVLTMGLTFSAEAGVYPVRDSEGILQQAKTYAESVKTVTEATKTALDTANMVKNQLMQLAKLPEEILNQQIAALNGSLNRIKGIVNDATNPKNLAPDLFREIDKQETFLKDIKNIPSGTSPVVIQVTVDNQINEENKKVLAAQQKATQIIKQCELDNQEATKKINELVEKAKTAKGENELLGIQVAIDGQKTVIDANNSRINLCKTQIEIVKDQADANKARIEQEAAKKYSENQNNSLDKLLSSDTGNSTAYNVKFSKPKGENPPW